MIAMQQNTCGRLVNGTPATALMSAMLIRIYIYIWIYGWQIWARCPILCTTWLFYPLCANNIDMAFFRSNHSEPERKGTIYAIYWRISTAKLKIREFVMCIIYVWRIDTLQQFIHIDSAGFKILRVMRMIALFVQKSRHSCIDFRMEKWSMIRSYRNGVWLCELTRYK